MLLTNKNKYLKLRLIIDIIGCRTFATEKEDEYFIMEALFTTNEENKDDLKNIQEKQKHIRNDSEGNPIITQNG